MNINNEDEFKWICPECGKVGIYFDLRKPFDFGFDLCINCGVEVLDADNIEEGVVKDLYGR